VRVGTEGFRECLCEVMLVDIECTGEANGPFAANGSSCSPFENDGVSYGGELLVGDIRAFVDGRRLIPKKDPKRMGVDLEAAIRTNVLLRFWQT
jgi:hypothetical protein